MCLMCALVCMFHIRTVRIAMHKGLLPLLREREAAVGATGRNGCSWHEEYGSWMLESTPEAPYSGFVRDLVRVAPHYTAPHRTTPHMRAAQHRTPYAHHPPPKHVRWL